MHVVWGVLAVLFCPLGPFIGPPNMWAPFPADRLCSLTSRRVTDILLTNHHRWRVQQWLNPAHLRFFWGLRWHRCAVSVLWTEETRRKYCETRPPDAHNGHAVTFIEPAIWQGLGSVLDIESWNVIGCMKSLQSPVVLCASGWLWLSPVMPGAIAFGTLSVPWSQVRDDVMDILTWVHIGKCLHSQTCMLHFSAKHHIFLVVWAVILLHLGYLSSVFGPQPIVLSFYRCQLPVFKAMLPDRSSPSVTRRWGTNSTSSAACIGQSVFTATQGDRQPTNHLCWPSHTTQLQFPPHCYT